MTPAWLIQTNLIKTDLQDGFRDACRAIGAAYHPCEVVPGYKLTLPPTEPNTVLIPYGSTTLIKNFSAAPP